MVGAATAPSAELPSSHCAEAWLILDHSEGLVTLHIVRFAKGGKNNLFPEINLIFVEGNFKKNPGSF